MSEHAPKSPELSSSPERTSDHEHTAEAIHKRAETAEYSTDKTSSENLEAIRKAVTQEAISGKDVKVETTSENSSASQPLITRQLKQQTLERSLVRIRKQLPVASRQLSKLVHTKPVEAISSVGEKTIARPVGLLGGSFSALVGSSFALYMAKHYGYRYNFLLFVLLFIGGYLLASVVELTLRILHRAKHGKS